jgi:hypothetical protein
MTSQLGSRQLWVTRPIAGLPFTGTDHVTVTQSGLPCWL